MIKSRLVLLYSNVSESKGVENKVRAQAEILSERFDVDLICVSSSSLVRVVRGMLRADVAYWRESVSVATILLLVLRRGRLVAECNRCYRNYVGRRSGRLLRLREFLSEMVYQRSSRMICVTAEIKNSFFGSPFYSKAAIFPNFYNYSMLERRLGDKVSVRRAAARLCFVGDLSQKWQGKYVIENILSACSGVTLFYIGPKVAFDGGVGDRVQQFGEIDDQDRIVDLCAQCSIGLSALNMRSRKMSQASPLKHAIYVAAGVHIVTSAYDQFLQGIYPISVVDSSESHDFVQVIESVLGGDIVAGDLAVSGQRQVAKRFSDVKSRFLAEFD